MSENSELADLEHRLSAALERIGTALEGLARPVAEPEAVAIDPPALTEATPEALAAPEAPATADETPPETPPATLPEDPSELARLRAALDDERIVTAQLEERIRRLKARTLAETEALKRELADARAALARMDAELQAQRRADDDLRAAAAALRAASETGVADAALINRALAAELAAVTATRNADAAEAEAILTAMAPLLTAPAMTEEV